MTKRFKITLVLLTVVLGIIGLAALVIDRSMRSVPPFYQVALEQDEAAQSESSDECLRQAAALVSDVQRSGRWQATFTADQINGWLAVDLAKNYPGALPPEVENPRVDLQNAQATLACGYKQGEKTTVVSIAFDLYLSEPNVLAVRVRSVRAGALPVPLSSVLDAISAAARNFDMEIQWRQAHGDPVALVRLPSASDSDDRELHLEAIELRDGAIYLAGQTGPANNNELARLERVKPTAPPPADEPLTSSEDSAAGSTDAETPDMDVAAPEDFPADAPSTGDAAAEDAPAEDPAAGDTDTEMSQSELESDSESATNENVQR